MIRGIHLFLGVLLLCATTFAQDAPQPQPAPALTNPQAKPAPGPATSPQQPAAAPPASSPTGEKQIVPAAAERHLHEAVIFEHDGNPESAEEEYKAAIREYPDYFQAHFYLGRLYLDRQGYSQAIAELKTAVNLRPQDSEAHDMLGLAMKRNGDLRGAVAEYQEAVRLNPRSPNAQSNLAGALYRMRDYNGAVQHYRAALALMPKESQKMNDAERNNLAITHMNLGTVFDDAGKPEDAIAEYKEAIRLQPRNADSHYNLSVLYQRRKNVSDAISELRVAAKLAPDWPTPHIMLANLLKDSDPKAALDQCMMADGLTHNAKLHDLCQELQRKAQ